MTYWLVRLEGDPADLGMLTDAEPGEGYRVIRHDGGFALISDHFDPASPAQVVIERARELVRLISGASMALLGTPRPLVAGSLSRVYADGREDQYLFPEPAVVTMRGLPATIVLTRADGSRETHRPADPIHAWLPVALHDERAARVLRIRARGPLDWDDLQRVIEVIESSGLAISSIPDAPSQADIDRLSRTANNVHALGDDARHPGRNLPAPRQPVTFADARAIVDRLISAWFQQLSKRLAGTA